MSKLGLEARELIAAGKTAMRPTLDDRSRIARSLRERIAGGAASGATVSPLAKLWASGFAKWSAVVVGLGASGLLVTGALVREEAARSVPAPVAPVVATVAIPDVAPPVGQAAPLPAAPALAVERQLSVDEAQARERKRPSDRLSEEVEILSRAQTELHAGRFTSALSSLEEHARRFPRGTLSQERRAARVRALCGLGRTTEADAELARLSPGSLHEGRAREACSTRKTAAR